MRTFLPYITCALCVASSASAATYLDTIPGPDDTGGMVMPLVGLNFNTKTVSVNMSQGNHVAMYSLQAYKVWGGQPYADAVFDPNLSGEAWYDLLDPSRQHLPFSTQYGFELISGNGHLIPPGAYVYIKATEITTGLKLYNVGYWADVWEQEEGLSMWFQAFGEGNYGGTLSLELDNVAAWGDSGSIKMWHPVALVPSPGLYSARFEIYLGDDYGRALDGWQSASITLNWEAIAVPEPLASALLLAAASLAVPVCLRRKRKKESRSTAQ